MNTQTSPLIKKNRKPAIPIFFNQVTNFDFCGMGYQCAWQNANIGFF